jgi:hypothetical protein
MTLTSVQQYGQIARAMAAVHQHKHPTDEVKGRITCPKCGSSLRFVILPNGVSRGDCTAACGIRWSQ